uniref:Enkurin, TRPC channel interacting protein n=1 Tax=Oryzias latipes TaxID=8090 RepID=A0A3B3IE48_ORYLA
MFGSMDPPENVYALIPKEEQQIQKPPRYVSSFHPAVVSENKLIKDVMRTMGPAKVELPSPDKYLKKHCKELQLPEQSHGSKGVSRACALTQRRPPVPARTDRPPMGQTKGGFIKPAVTAPLKPTPVSVDSHKGHKQLLETSGLVPKYVTKKDYGEVPAYLQRRSEAQWRSQEEHARVEKEQEEQEAMQQLTEEERQAALQVGLMTCDAGGGVVQKLLTFRGKAEQIRLPFLNSTAFILRVCLVACCGFPPCFPSAASEEEVGRSARGVPAPPSHHRDHVEESLQEKSGRCHESAGQGHLPLGEVPHHLHHQELVCMSSTASSGNS